MASNLGLLGGLGQGLMQGVSAFNDARKMNLTEDKEAREAKASQLGLDLKAKEAGYQIDPGGGLIETEAGKQKRKDAHDLSQAHAGYFGAKAKQDNLDKDSGKAFSDLQHNKDYQKAAASLDEADSLRKNVAEAMQNPYAAKALGVYAARYATGGQRLNQMEIQALGGRSDAVLDKLNQIATTAASGTLTPENAGYMQKFIDLTAKGHEATKNKIEDEYMGSFARRKGMEPDAASGLILGHPTSATRQKQTMGAQGLIPGAAGPEIPEGTVQQSRKTGAKRVWKGGQWQAM